MCGSSGEVAVAAAAGTTRRRTSGARVLCSLGGPEQVTVEVQHLRAQDEGFQVRRRHLRARYTLMLAPPRV